RSVLRRSAISTPVHIRSWRGSAPRNGWRSTRRFPSLSIFPSATGLTRLLRGPSLDCGIEKSPELDSNESNGWDHQTHELVLGWNGCRRFSAHGESPRVAQPSPNRLRFAHTFTTESEQRILAMPS